MWGTSAILLIVGLDDRQAYAICLSILSGQRINANGTATDNLTRTSV